MYIYFMHSSEKDNHPSSLPQQGFCTSLQIWDELSVTWQTKPRFFFCLPSQGPLILKHSLFMTLSGLGFLVESPILYLAFLKIILAALFRTFGLPFVSCLQNLHFSTIILPPNIRIFPVFLAVSTTDKPVHRGIHAMPSHSWTGLC